MPKKRREHSEGRRRARILAAVSVTMSWQMTAEGDADMAHRNASWTVGRPDQAAGASSIVAAASSLDAHKHRRAAQVLFSYRPIAPPRELG